VNPLYEQIRKTPLMANIGSLFIIQLMNYVIPIVVLPVLTLRLDSNYGIIVTAQYFSALLMFACDYGFVYTGPRQVSQNQGNTFFLHQIYSTITFIKLFFLATSFLVTFIYCSTVKMTTEECQVLFISLLAVAGNVLTPLWFLQGVQRIRSLTVISIVFKTLQLVLLIVCIHSKSDLLLASWIFFGSGFLLGLCSFIYTIWFFKIKFVLPAGRFIRTELKGGFSMFLSVFFSSVYIQGTGLLLRVITGNNDVVAVYGNAEKIVRAATSLFNPFVQAFLPFISKMFVMNVQLGSMMFFKFLYVVIGVTLFTTVMVYLLSGVVVHMMFEPKMEPVIAIMCILCPIILFGNISNLMGNNLFLLLGWEQITVIVMFLLAVFNSLMCYLLIPTQGANGAAIALTCTEALGGLSFYAYYRYKNRF
jgi:PST family polysaccharide transporter